MAIDPSISLAVRPPVIPPLQIQSPLERFAKVLSLRNLMTENQSGQIGLQEKQLGLQQAQRGIADEQSLRDLLINNPNAGAAEVIGAGGPVRGMAWLKSQADAEKARLDRMTQANTLNVANAKRRAELASGVTDLEGAKKAVFQAAGEQVYDIDPAKNAQIARDVIQHLQTNGFNPDEWKAHAQESMDYVARQELADKVAEEKRKADESAAKLPGLKADTAQKVRIDNATTLAGALTQGPQAFADALAKLKPEDAAPFAAAKTVPEVLAIGSTPHERITAVETARHNTEQEARARATADPFGLLGLNSAGTPTADTGAGPTPSPLAQAIANFEGFNKADSVAQRNNNPGNLRAGPGQTGTDKNGYAIFPDVNTGWDALHALIQKRSGDNLTLQEFFGGKKGVYPGYAPAADRNDPANYAATVAKGLGVEPTAKLGDIAGSQTPVTARPGTRLTADMQGTAVLAALPGPLAQQVKAISEGRITFPTGQALRTPYWQQMLGIVGQYDPSFDTNNPGKRAATAKDFASGTSARQVNALNTVVGHLDSLSQAADKLNNSSLPAYNTVANWISANTGHPQVKTFEATKKAVVDELTRVWRGTGGSEGDIKSWSATLDAAGSPDQLHSVIAQIGDLLESKLSALQDQYREGMGTISQGRQMITPDARKTLDKLEKKAGGTPAKTQKTATVDQLKAYAQKHNTSEAEARKAAEAEGFVIQ